MHLKTAGTVFELHGYLDIYILNFMIQGSYKSQKVVIDILMSIRLGDKWILSGTL